MGVIPQSGLVLREPYRAFDAERRFGVTAITAEESSSPPFETTLSRIGTIPR
ncbi:MAG: hypothetical protein HY287_13085 [Planctomycetes bacterium]|nr:hypothetical protein [Planctomycetota bacterium]